jgi:hypothetical protein
VGRRDMGYGSHRRFRIASPRHPRFLDSWYTISGREAIMATRKKARRATSKKRAAKRAGSRSKDSRSKASASKTRAAKASTGRGSRTRSGGRKNAKKRLEGAKTAVRRRARQGVEVAREGFEKVKELGERTWGTVRSTTTDVVQSMKQRLANDSDQPEDSFSREEL